MKCRKFKGYYLKLNEVADRDIIERLESAPNKQGYIKNLIRIDISLDGLRNSFREEDT